MTDLDRAAAEAMGWEWHEESKSYYTGGPRNDRTSWRLGFAPTKYPDDWWQFVQFMDEKGWKLKINTVPDTFPRIEWWFWSPKREMWLHSSSHSAKLDSLSDLFPATINASLAALGVRNDL